MADRKGFANAKALGAQAIIDKVRAAGLLEYGIEREPVAYKWDRVIAGKEKADYSVRVACGLNNADTEEVLLKLLADDPEKILAGMAIAAEAIGTEEKWLYLPEKWDPEEEGAENATFVKTLKELAEAYSVDLHFEIVNVRANKDSAIHHIETAAALTEIFEEAYEPGTYMAVKTVTAGDQEKMGELKKVRFGTSVRDLVAEAGADMDAIQAVALGTKLYDASALDTVVEADTQIGNGVITVFDNTCCLLHEANKVLLKSREKSCGKCTFCREGLFQLHQMTIEITNGLGKKEFTDMMQEIGEAMVISTPCTMGQTGSDFTMGTFKYFESEYTDHIRKKECSHGVCEAFLSFYIDPKKCTSSGACVDVCPEGAIEGKDGYVHVIDEFSCTKCGKCVAVCAQGAVIKTSGKVPKLPKKPVRVAGAKGKAAAGAVAAEETKEKKKKRKTTVLKPAAGGKFAAAVEPKKEEPKRKGDGVMKKLEADVIIAGGGPAGLAAAVTAGEHGLTTIIFEKTNTTGGAANMGMGPLGIGTKIQKNMFNDITVEDAFDIHMNYTHYRVDADLVSTYFAKSADTIEWLEDLGVEFAGAYRYFTESAATWHIVKPENGIIGPRAAGPMARIMAEKAQETGTTIYLETWMESLIYEDGKVCGVIATDKDGNQYEARGKAVVVATGGFGNNAEIVKEISGLDLWENFHPFRIPAHQGEGLKGMWEIGAEKYGGNLEIIYQLKDNMNWFLMDTVFRQPIMLVNQRGDRFMNEQYMGNTTFTGNAIREQPGCYAYSIMDDGLLNYYKKNGPDIFDIVHPEEAFEACGADFARAIEEGYDGYFEADTIEELAEQMGIDPDTLAETIETYNEYCAEGVDHEFHKKQAFLHPITGKGKYRAARFYVAAYGSIGGVRINKYCEVMDEDQNPIPGLYAAGNDSNIIYGDSYNFTLPGNSMGFAVNSGRMAGEALAEYIEDMDD